MMIQKWIGFWILWFFVTATFAAAAALPPNNFPKTLNLGGESWRLDNYQEDKNLQLGEYVIKNENVNNWTKLLTFQKFKFALNKDVTPKKFAEKEFEALNSQKLKIVSSIVSSNDQEAVIEFRVLEPKANQQDEVQRIIITPDRNLVILHYVIKNSDMGAAARKAWIAALNSFDISQLK